MYSINMILICLFIFTIKCINTFEIDHHQHHFHVKRSVVVDDEIPIPSTSSAEKEKRIFGRKGVDQFDSSKDLTKLETDSTRNSSIEDNKEKEFLKSNTTITTNTLEKTNILNTTNESNYEQNITIKDNQNHKHNSMEIIDNNNITTSKLSIDLLSSTVPAPVQNSQTSVTAINTTSSTVILQTPTVASMVNTTTTTPKPKKPTITESVLDDPTMLDVKIDPISNESLVTDKHPIIEEPNDIVDADMATSNSSGHREYIIPVVVIIFAIPMLLGLITIITRRIKDYWSTRHYRRMDFLVDGMYND